MNQQHINNHRPHDSNFQMLGLVQGIIGHTEEGWLKIDDLIIYDNHRVGLRHDGTLALVKFWCNDGKGTPGRVRKVLFDAEKIAGYELQGPTLLVTAYLEPGTGKLVVPISQERSTRTKNDYKKNWRIELDMQINIPPFPVTPGKRYDLIGHLKDGQWHLDWEKLSERGRPKQEQGVKRVSIKLIDVVLPKHTGAILNPMKTEPTMAYVATHHDLQEPLVVEEVAGRYNLLSGIRGLLVAKRFGLEKVPVITQRTRKARDYARKKRDKGRG